MEYSPLQFDEIRSKPVLSPHESRHVQLIKVGKNRTAVDLPFDLLGTPSPKTKMPGNQPPCPHVRDTRDLLLSAVSDKSMIMPLLLAR